MLKKYDLRILALSLLTPYLLTSCASKTPLYRSFNYSADLFSQENFISHDEKGAFKSYLAMNVRFAPVAELRQRLETEISQTLLHRSEAHITVISPVEFDKVLAKKLKMKEINDLVKSLNIQNSRFRPICIGKGQLDKLETYFIVVSSDDLFRIRTEIQKLFVKKGGAEKDFNPDLYYPHITLGFTERDLHFEDGVRKDESLCVYRLHE